MENLFDNPTTLRNPTHFIGRRDKLERIFALIKRKQNIALVGARRIGKTSLMNCLCSPEIQRKFDVDGDGLLFLYFDLQRGSMKERVDFFDDILQVLREYGQNLGYRVEEGLAKDDEFDFLLDMFQESKLHPVLMLDTFDEIMQYQPVNANVFNFLRYEGGKGKISYIIASVESLWNILRRLLPTGLHISSPFHNIFGMVKLICFSDAEVQEYLRNTSEKGGLRFSDEEIAWVARLAGKHPFLLQQVASLLFEEKRIHGLEPGDFTQIRKEAQQNLFYYFEDCWLAMDSNERQLLIEDTLQFQKGGVPATQMSNEHPELCYSELFYDYLSAMRRLPVVSLVDLSVEEFKALLEHIEDTEELGASALTGIPFIAASIDQQRALSPAIRGKIVQKALLEALERLKGQGTRVDRARDWTDYNILYYRYFMRRHDLSQEGVAKKLSISSRQYYRLFPGAVERLWKALRDLDATASLLSDA